MDNLKDDDLNFLSENLKSEDLMNLTRGKSFSLLAKILMKNPKLVTLAKYLL